MSAQDALVQIAVTVGTAHMLRVIRMLLRFGAETLVAAVTVRLTVRLQFADLVLGALVRGARVCGKRQNGSDLVIRCLEKNESLRVAFVMS